MRNVISYLPNLRGSKSTSLSKSGFLLVLEARFTLRKKKTYYHSVSQDFLIVRSRKGSSNAQYFKQVYH